MSELKAHITSAMKIAMKAKNKERLSIIRLILADIKKIEVDERIDVSDERILVILDKMKKQRNDSITQFMSANRQDLAATEQYELEVISEFLPAAFTESEIETIVIDAIATCAASSMQDMGKVMASIKPMVQGRADMAVISKLIKSRLA